MNDMDSIKLILSIIAAIIGLVLVSMKLIDYTNNRKDKGKEKTRNFKQKTDEGSNFIKSKKEVDTIDQKNTKGDNTIDIG